MASKSSYLAPRLQTIPPELQVLIFTFALALGLLDPYLLPRDHDDPDYTPRITSPSPHRPSVALLRTCRKTHDQAEPLLYLNHFRFSSLPALKDFIMRGSPERTSRFRIKTLELAFEWHPFQKGDIDDIVTETNRLTQIDVANGKEFSSERDRRRLRLNLSWRPMMELVLEHLRPRKFILGLDHCRDEQCRDGECWVQHMAIGTLKKGFVNGFVPEKVELKGYKGTKGGVKEVLTEEMLLKLVRRRTVRRSTGVVKTVLMKGDEDKEADEAESRLMQAAKEEEMGFWAR